MPLLQVYRNEHALIEAKHEDNLVVLTWLQHSSGDTSKEVLQIVLQYALAHHLTRWLYDLRKLNYITIADQSWTVQEIHSSLDERSNHHIAYVASPDNVEMVPDDLINKLIQQNANLTVRLETSIFLDMELAEYWLLSKNPLLNVKQLIGHQ